MSNEQPAPTALQFRGMDCNLLAAQYRRYLETGAAPYVPLKPKDAAEDGNIFEPESTAPETEQSLLQWIYEKLFAARPIPVGSEA